MEVNIKSRSLNISGFNISDDSDVFVIAEIGHNHQGNIELCESMFVSAAKAGVNAVKLQKRANASLYTPNFFNQPYLGPTSFGATYGAHREFLEFNFEQYKHLKKFAENLGLIFFATAFDVKSVDFLKELAVPAIKIASGDLRSTPLLRYAAKTEIPLIISTGGANLIEVKNAISLVNPKKVGLLQCTAAYPAEAKVMNLNVMSTFRNTFPETVIGLSSHDVGISYPVIAAVLGARIIEKHFTIDRSLKGTDHSFSLEPLGMEKMCRDLKNVPIALGSYEKNSHESEILGIRKMGKMVVYSSDLSIGTKLSDQNLEIRSPLEGISASHWDSIVGKTLKKNVCALDPVAYDDFS
jgi:N-acetylneuraminate synthase/sialic acid synthase